MKKEVIIGVTGTQRFAEGYDNKQEFMTVGTLNEHKGFFYLSYQESEINGMEGVTTILRIEPNHVILKRSGSAEAKQEFRPGVLYRSTYITPIGNLLLSVLPEKVESYLTAQGGRISLKYDLFVDDKFVSHNALVITIKEDPLNECLRNP